jgi:hypothetical protein
LDARAAERGNVTNCTMVEHSLKHALNLPGSRCPLQCFFHPRGVRDSPRFVSFQANRGIRPDGFGSRRAGKAAALPRWMAAFIRWRFARKWLGLGAKIGVESALTIPISVWSDSVMINL